MSVLASYSQFRSFFGGSTTAADGHKAWVSSRVRSGGFVNINRPKWPLPLLGILMTNFPVRMYATGTLVADAVSGVPEYDWYVSQRTDDPSKQPLAVTQYPTDNVTLATYSGAIEIRKSTLGATLWPSNAPTLEGDAIGLFKNVYVYVRRRSDNAIQVVDMIASLFSDG